MNGGPALTCRDERRRRDVRAAPHLNGLDYLEVSEDQLTLTVYFLGKAPESLRRENVVIKGCAGGARQVRVVDLRLCRLADPERDDCLHLTVDRPGDFSLYSLCLVEVAEIDGRGPQPTGQPLAGFDPRYACLPLDWKIGCPSDLDCKVEPVCPAAPRHEPEIDYLAKDYSSFRQLILDRLSLTLPDWRERHVPDLGIALVELLAYVGDHLSYYQDAVATEAYLGTARRRISVRRHARFVDYPMHEGCNARTWVCVHTGADLDLLARDFYCITSLDPAPPPGKPLGENELRGLPAGSYEVFEPLAAGAGAGSAIALREARNEIQLYTWGDRECCLPRGATRATLRGDAKLLDLNPGDFLLFEEVLGPKTGSPDDADPAHRHVVRLTRVTAGVDPLYGRTGKQQGQPVVEIEWALADALLFPLCLSAIGPAPECAPLSGVSVARGNLFLADHGRTIAGEPLGSVPVVASVATCECEGRPSDVVESAGRFAPGLQLGPLTFSQPLPHPGRTRRRRGPVPAAPAPPAPPPAGATAAPAAGLLLQDPRQALPAVTLAAAPAPPEAAAWSARWDLLESAPEDADFVVEMDDDGRARLRFGDGELGRAPLAGTAFSATYRVGNGPAGNLGAEALRHLVLRGLTLSGVSLTPRNPLPAMGGTAPEPLAEVRLLAPYAFRATLERAITAADYAALVERDFAGRVLRAAATLRWTGSWTEVLVAVDPLSAEADVAGLLREIRGALHRYRQIGHDVVVRQAETVALDVALIVCVLPHFLRGHVEAALLEELGSRTLPDGRRGVFHPDNLPLGQGIALSRLVAAAQAVAGVESVVVARFQRLHHRPNHEIEQGFLPLGPLQVARLDDDPRFPERGRLKLDLRGGR